MATRVVCRDDFVTTRAQVSQPSRRHAAERAAVVARRGGPPAGGRTPSPSPWKDLVLPTLRRLRVGPGTRPAASLRTGPGASLRVAGGPPPPRGEGGRFWG